MKANSRSPYRILPPATPEQIAALAYAIWEDRGRPDGRDVDCWMEAERELKGAVPSNPPATGSEYAGDFCSLASEPDRGRSLSWGFEAAGSRSASRIPGAG